jgi:hypothetical protein
MNNQNKKSYNIKLYQTIRENGGAWDMQPHSEYPCNSKTEMNIEEERVRQELKADLNMNSCYGLDIENFNKYQKEYYNINKDKKKEYRLANKEKIKEYHREYYLKNKT